MARWYCIIHATFIMLGFKTQLLHLPNQQVGHNDYPSLYIAYEMTPRFILVYD